jgi:hypothetical protein
MLLSLAVAPEHVLHASTQAEQHRSPTQNSALTCIWYVQRWHGGCWKASNGEKMGKFSSGPVLAVVAIA